MEFYHIYTKTMGNLLKKNSFFLKKRLNPIFKSRLVILTSNWYNTSVSRQDVLPFTLL